jgi:hypothetical protein
MAEMANPESKVRWYHPSPSWLVLLSLAATGFLFMAQQVHWFAFDGQKGWTVLLAVAAVGAFFLATLLWFVMALVFRWRFQFGLRTLLLMAVALALPMSWLGVARKKAEEQRKAVERIQAVDELARFTYDDDPEIDRKLQADWPGSPWSTCFIYCPANTPAPAPAATPTLATKVQDRLQSVLGNDFFHDVKIVCLGCKTIEHTLAEVKHLLGTQVVELDDVDDATIESAIAELRPKLPGVMLRRAVSQVQLGTGNMLLYRLD